MNKTKRQLKSIWEREKESYKNQEVGSGVQKFVKDILECQDIFNLKEGELSTPTLIQKNVFIHENRTKDRRRADFVIYINPEIIIPVEVEQFTNIEQGTVQLFQYQCDLEKKYGILTDGYTWRFYNNNIYRTFTLELLLSETNYFLEFWKEYIKPEYYYLSFFEKSGQLSFFNVEDIQIENNRQLFFKDITTLIKSFTHKLRIEGYFNGIEGKEALKKATEITYAYIIQFILYKTLVDNKFDNFENDYKEILNTIRNAIKSHSYKEILGVIDGMSHQISKNIYRPFNKEQEYIGVKFLDLYRKAKNQLSDVSPWLDIIVFINKYIFLNIHNDIFGYVYENYLKEIYEDKNKGQYFTEPAVVNFMLGQIGYTENEIRNSIKVGKLNNLSIVDPACGSGTFLYSATDKIVKSFNVINNEVSKQIEEIVTSNIFGLDVEEFPLYLAEMNILMRMLPLIVNEKYNSPLEKKIKVFWTQDSISEFVGSGIENTDADISRREGQLSYFGKLVQPVFHSYVRDEDDLKEMKDSMALFPRRRFDYVIANPPYIRYNDCIKQGMLIFKLMKKGKVKLSNIYGVNLHSTPFNHKKYAPKPNLYAFFIALGLALLKENGRFCYIIPQTILVNPDFDVLRYHLAKYTTIEKITIFDSKMFVSRGLKQNRIIPTSSLVIVVSKRPPSINQKVEIFNYHTLDKKEDIKITMQNISKGHNIIKNTVLQSQLLSNIDNWNFIRQSTSSLDLINQYRSNTEPLSIYYEHSVAENIFHNRFYIDGGAVINTKFIRKESSNAFEIIDKLSDLGYTIPNSQIYYPKNVELTFPQGSQGIASFFQRYKVIWRTKNTQKFHYTDRNVLLVTNKYLMISSNHREEILYLLSLLNSKVTRFILEHVIKVNCEDTNTVLVSLRVIKEQIRVPEINSCNIDVKEEIIKITDQMLALEDKTLSDFVDFSGVLLQKFDDVYIFSDELVLVHDKVEIKLPINNNVNLVTTTIKSMHDDENLIPDKRKITLNELRSMNIVDLKKQSQLKNYIDDLVFALYFNIELNISSLKNSKNVHDACLQNQFYKSINTY